MSIESIKTPADALRWALTRIANSNLGQGEYFARALELLQQLEAAPLTDEPPGARQTKLRALADRIDHEQLWRRPGLEHRDWPQDKRDRLDAGVNLRRYAELLQPGRWVIFPPTGPVRFSAQTLDVAYGMAKKEEARITARSQATGSKT